MDSEFGGKKASPLKSKNFLEDEMVRVDMTSPSGSPKKSSFMQKSQTNKVLETESTSKAIPQVQKMNPQKSQKIVMQSQMVKDDQKSFI